MNLNLTKLTAALVTAVNAVIGLVLVFAHLAWTPEQELSVHAVVTLAAGLGVVIYAHLRPGTAREPIAIAGTLGTLASASVAMLLAFHIVNEVEASGVGLAAAALIGVVAVFARDSVTPVLPPPGAELFSPLPPAAGR